MKKSGQEKLAEHPLFAGLLLFLLFWIISSLISVLVFHEGTFLQLLITPNKHEIFIRIMMGGCLILFAFYFRSVLKKRSKLEAELEAALLKAEHEQKKSDTIMESLGDSISIQTPDLKIIYQNNMCKKVIGDHVGNYCYSGYHQLDAPCPECILIKSFKDGEVHRYEKQSINLGRLMWVEIIASVIKDASGKIVAGVEVARDITDRKISEEKIRNLNAELARQTRELAMANKELEAFSASVSHDLRSPLTRIYTSGQALSEYDTLLDDSGRFFLKTITDASEQMEDLIEALLSLSRVAQREKRHGEVNLSEIAENCAQILKHKDPQRNVEFVITPGLVTSGDYDLLGIALHNLLENSWKYSGKTSAPKIEFGITEHSGEYAYFVRDNGAGFDMKYADLLFKPFQRFHQDSDFIGTGVGLATVQRIIQRHHGTIWGEGEPGKGATFYFTLLA
jgi:PAS domain S-box-containing protein